MINNRQQVITLLEQGTPIFPLTLGPGFSWTYPRNWQLSPVPPIEEVDEWVDMGYGLGAVSGETYDFIDLDTDEKDCYDRERLESVINPLVCGTARTPSGGYHYVLPRLGVKSTRYAPGLDIKSGFPDRVGRGNIRICPTSKFDPLGVEIGRYEWTSKITVPTLDQLALVPSLRTALERLLERREARIATGLGLSPAARSGSPWLAWNAAKKTGALADYFELMGGRDNGVFLLCASLAGTGKFATPEEIVTELEMSGVEDGVALVQSDHAWPWSNALQKARSAMNMHNRKG